MICSVIVSVGAGVLLFLLGLWYVLNVKLSPYRHVWMYIMFSMAVVIDLCCIAMLHYGGQA